MAKVKREKKAEKAEKIPAFRCNVCLEIFLSKAKLFDHIMKNPGHARQVK